MTSRLRRVIMRLIIACQLLSVCECVCVVCCFHTVPVAVTVGACSRVVVGCADSTGGNEKKTNLPKGRTHTPPTTLDACLVLLSNPCPLSCVVVRSFLFGRFGFDWSRLTDLCVGHKQSTHTIHYTTHYTKRNKREERSTNNTQERNTHSKRGDNRHKHTGGTRVIGPFGLWL